MPRAQHVSVRDPDPLLELPVGGEDIDPRSDRAGRSLRGLRDAQSKALTKAIEANTVETARGRRSIELFTGIEVGPDDTD